METAYINFRDTDVWFKVEDETLDLRTPLAKALDIGEDRWRDPEYLARIMFDTYRDQIGVHNIGLTTEFPNDKAAIVFINCFDEPNIGIADATSDETATFDEFVDAYAPS